MLPLVDPQDDGIRPAGKPDECFYCNQKVGTPHDAECVCLKRRIRARYTYEIELEVPHKWTSADFEFHRNDSSWCSDNSIRELEEFSEELEKRGDGCFCSGRRFKAEWIEVLRDEPIRELRKPEEEPRRPSPAVPQGWDEWIKENGRAVISHGITSDQCLSVQALRARLAALSPSVPVAALRELVERSHEWDGAKIIRSLATLIADAEHSEEKKNG